MTRFLVFGAGAVGGVVGARLAQSGHDVALVARGDHRDAIERDGLRIDDPDGSTTLRLPVTDDVSLLDPSPGDVVLISVKGQHTVDAIDALAPWAPDLPVICLQNGTSNEPAFLRVFEHVYAVPVMLPAAHLEPGVVQASSSPTTGILDIGRYPAGIDERCEELSAAFAASIFESVPRPDQAPTTVAASATRWSFVHGGPSRARGPWRTSSARSPSCSAASPTTVLAS